MIEHCHRGIPSIGNAHRLLALRNHQGQNSLGLSLQYQLSNRACPQILVLEFPRILQGYHWGEIEKYRFYMVIN
nr:MAG TPA: hypothetical protein [Caudoviricetes sp.]